MEEKRQPTGDLNTAAEGAVRGIQMRLEPRGEGEDRDEHRRAVLLATKKRIYGASWNDVREAFPQLRWKDEEPIARFEEALMERQYVYVPTEERLTR